MQPLGPDVRTPGNVVITEPGDGLKVAAHIARNARTRVIGLQIEHHRQRLDDCRLALLGAAKLLLRAQPLGIGAQVGVEQSLLVPRLALDLLRFLEQLDEHRDLGLQDDRIDRLEHIIDRAHRIAAQQMLGFLIDRRQEDDRDALGLVAAADDLGGLIAVHAGHVDVEQDDREFALEEVPERFFA